jgi:hypothetical protein
MAWETNKINESIQERLQRILQQPMDRKQFLQTSGLVVLTAIGLGQLVRLLQSSENADHLKVSKNDSISGPNAYGGNRKSSKIIG